MWPGFCTVHRYLGILRKSILPRGLVTAGGVANACRSRWVWAWSSLAPYRVAQNALARGAWVFQQDPKTRSVKRTLPRWNGAKPKGAISRINLGALPWRTTKCQFPAGPPEHASPPTGAMPSGSRSPARVAGGGAHCSFLPVCDPPPPAAACVEERAPSMRPTKRLVATRFRSPRKRPAANPEDSDGDVPGSRQTRKINPARPAR